MDMDTKFKKAFETIVGAKSLDFLQTRILARIDQEQAKKVTIGNIISRTVGAVSLVAIFPLVINIFAQLQNSGFFSYLSLVFTDTGTVATYWKELSLSLVESAPLAGITLILMLVLILSISIKFSNISFKRNVLLAKLV